MPESQQDAVTALSGSGPAYFFYLVEAMVDAGILLGLPRALAADLIVQTALGAAVMMRDSGEHPVQLREAVSSPGGTTVAAIRELEKHGVRAALMAAIEAAHARSVELGATATTGPGGGESRDRTCLIDLRSNDAVVVTDCARVAMTRRTTCRSASTYVHICPGRIGSSVRFIHRSCPMCPLTLCCSTCVFSCRWGSRRHDAS